MFYHVFILIMFISRVFTLLHAMFPLQILQSCLSPVCSEAQCSSAHLATITRTQAGKEGRGRGQELGRGRGQDHGWGRDRDQGWGRGSGGAGPSLTCQVVTGWSAHWRLVPVSPVWRLVTGHQSSSHQHLTVSTEGRAEITAVTVDCSAAPAPAAPARPGLARRCCLASCCLVWFGLVNTSHGRHGNMGRVTPHTWLSP